MENSSHAFTHAKSSILVEIPPLKLKYLLKLVSTEQLFHLVLPLVCFNLLDLTLGIHEAVELRDGGDRYMGKGVLKAIDNVKTIIAPKLKGMDVTKQSEIDQAMIELDGTNNKSKLGANAILGVSMAVARAAATVKQIPLWKYLAELAGTQPKLPVPCFNILNGGTHAGNALAVQEYMISPFGAETFSQAMQMGCEIYQNLKKIVKSRYGQDAVNVGDEGGFAPPIVSSAEPLDLIVEAIEKSGYTGKVSISIDAAASEFFENGKYNLGFKTDQPDIKTGDELVAYYLEWIEKYPILSMEDPFDQDDVESYSKLTAAVPERCQVVGDDICVTNPQRIQMCMDKKACNSLLLKVNQIGSLTEAIQAAKMCFEAGWSVMVSHRSGETEDSFIADLVTAIGCGQIKTGAPCRSERLAKYNQLLRIEEQLGSGAVYGYPKWKL
ncbi:hypothetical protein P9112_010722 [Eukaryota sp. TZLM1-RC]